MSRLTISLIILCLCAPAWSANDFTDDPNVVMWQKFDTGEASGAYTIFRATEITCTIRVG